MSEGSQSLQVDRLWAVIERLETEVAALRAENRALRDVNTELRRRLDSDSTNSSRPPSSDPPFAKPARKRSGRSRSGRKPGKQAGAGGVSRPLTDDPDTIVRLEPGACGGCGASLAGALGGGVMATV